MIDMRFIEENNVYPLLIIGDAVTDFKKNYNGMINSAEDLDSMRELVAYYSRLSCLDRPLVIEDISLFAKNGEGILLKFIEESKLDLILLSRFDKVSNILLSRVKRVIKYYKEPVTSQFLTVSKGSEALESALEPGSHYYDKVRYMGKLSPKQYYLEKSIKLNRIKSKILSFVE